MGCCCTAVKQVSGLTADTSVTSGLPALLEVLLTRLCRASNQGVRQAAEARNKHCSCRHKEWTPKLPCSCCRQITGLALSRSTAGHSSTDSALAVWAAAATAAVSVQRLRNDVPGAHGILCASPDTRPAGSAARWGPAHVLWEPASQPYKSPMSCCAERRWPAGCASN